MFSMLDRNPLSRRTRLTRFNSVETQATYDATNRLLGGSSGDTIHN